MPAADQPVDYSDIRGSCVLESHGASRLAVSPSAIASDKEVELSFDFDNDGCFCHTKNLEHEINAKNLDCEIAFAAGTQNRFRFFHAMNLARCGFQDVSKFKTKRSAKFVRFGAASRTTSPDGLRFAVQAKEERKSALLQSTVRGTALVALNFRPGAHRRLLRAR